MRTGPRHPLLGGASLLLLVIAGCKASFPVEPSASPRFVGFHLQYVWPHDELLERQQISMVAYAVDVDGAFHQLTSGVTWVSSAPNVLRLALGPDRGVFQAVSPGESMVTATYERFTDSLPLGVQPFVRPPPRLRLSQSGNLPILFGVPERGAFGLRAALDGRDVTALASWFSSDPGVASVDRGVITGHAPGNVQIVAAYNGVTARYFVPVPPRREGIPKP